MRAVTRSVLALILASVAATPPLLAGRPVRPGDAATDPGRHLSPADRGNQSEPSAPGATAPQRPALGDAAPRITPFCEPVPEKFFIRSLGSIATDLGTAGYVIDQPGRYVVTRDLAVPDVDIGILVLAHDVVLDLRGHSVTDNRGNSTLIRIEGTRGFRISDGTLSGGGAGLVARMVGFAGRLALRDMRIRGNGSAYRAVVGEGSVDLVVRDSEIRGGAVGLYVPWSTPASLVVNSSIKASQSGLRMGEGRILGNSIQAPDAVEVGDGPAFVTGNRIEGAPAGVAALRVGSGFVRDNVIRGAGAAHALVMGDGFVEGNEIRGGEESTILLEGHGIRLRNNSIVAQGTGIVVGGFMNAIEGNLIRGEGIQCGISFVRTNDHVYRNNVIRGAANDVCGEPNIDGGGNQLASPCGVKECGTWLKDFSSGVGSLSREKMQGLEPAPVEKSRPCEPGEVITISDWSPVETEYGQVGLLFDAPGYYLLTNDIALEEYDSVRIGILITAPDVTLDLGHHSVFVFNASRPVRVVGSENTVIRDGELNGGSQGLEVDGDKGSSSTGIRLERVWIHQGYSMSYGPLHVEDVDRVEVFDSLLDGVEFGSSVRGECTGLIRGSDFQGIDYGLRLSGFNDGLVIDSRISGDQGLTLGSRNILKRSAARSLRLDGSLNSVSDSDFGGGHSGDDGMHVDGDGNLIRDTSIGGTVKLWGSENRLIGCTTGNGVIVEGGDNHLVNNFITGNECGVKFRTDAGHLYKGNIVVDVDEGICGGPNTDGGGNVLPDTICGNRITAVTEVCDFNYYSSEACRALGFEEGEVWCNPTCDGYDTSRCGTCGDAIAGGLEECDGADVRGKTCLSKGFDAGTLACTGICSFDLSGCRRGCGNGILDAGEVCENPGGFWSGDSCQAHGFEGGLLRCNWSCDGFTFYDCVGGCGNEQAEGNEQCDRTMHGSQCWKHFDYQCSCRDFGLGGNEALGCNDDCTFDFSACGCGDGVVDQGEVCDTTLPVDQTCATQGFEGGVLGCATSCLGYDTSQCTGGCGNGVAEGTEQCDGQAHNADCPASGCRCEDSGLGTGRLGCTSSCEFDASICLPVSSSPYCGNARAEAGEACDGADLAGWRCQDLGFVGGSFGCRPDCTRDLAGCIGNGICGDGMRRGAEECDEMDIGNVTCQSLGYASGYPSCTNDCRVDARNCSSCGNDIREGSESCDGTDLAGQTCGSVGKPWGTLSCTSICTFNTSQCVGF